MRGLHRIGRKVSQMAMRNPLFFLALFVVFSLTRHATALVSPISTPQNDSFLVEKQLGYLPPNYRQVSAWTMDGKSPVAIQTYPLDGGVPRRQAKAKASLSLRKPFPTLYWLTSPEISRDISDLERRGYVSELEHRLNDNQEDAARFLACHEHYAKERWLSLRDNDRVLLERNDSTVQRMCDMLKCSGVAGTNHKAQIQPDGSFVASVKCLHAHYAHYRSNQVEKDEIGFNPIGFWVHELLLQEFPDTNL